MTLSVRRLATVLDAIRRDLPGVRRVSSYCLPRNVRKKSAAETDGKRHRIAVGQENALDALPKFLAAAADAFEDFLFATGTKTLLRSSVHFAERALVPRTAVRHWQDQ